MNEIVERRFSMMRKLTSYLVVFLFIGQSIVDSTEGNILSSLTVLLVSLVVINYCFRSNVFLNAPLTVVSLTGYWVAVQFGPLFYQTLTLNSMTESLHDGVMAFGITGIFLISLILGSVLYRRSDFLQSLRVKIQSSVIEPLGLFVQPSTVILYSMGFIGLLSLILTGAHDEGTKYGDASSKFVEAFRVFVYAPFARAIIPGVRDQMRGIYPKMDRGIVLYVVALLIVGMLRNARGLMIIGILVLILNSTLFLMQNEKKIEIKASNIIALLIVSVPLIYMFTYLAEAMAAVRGLRSDLSPIQILTETINILGDRASVLAYLESVKNVTQFEAYDEFYISNAAAARLITLRFDDNMIYFGGILDSADISYANSLLFDSLLAILPTPVLQFFGVNIYKEDLIYSAGDVIVALATGMPMSGFKTGSLPAGLYLTFGYFYPFVGILAGCLGSFAFDNFSRIRNNALELSPFALLGIYSIFILYMQDSWVSFTFQITRALFEGMVLYILVLILFGYRFRHKSVK